MKYLKITTMDLYVGVLKSTGLVYANHVTYENDGEDALPAVAVIRQTG